MRTTLIRSTTGAALAAIALVVTACGGSSNPKTPMLNSAKFSAQAETICGEGQATALHLAGQFTNIANSQTAGVLQKLLSASQAMDTDLDTLRGPRNLEAARDNYVMWDRRQEHAMQTAINAANNQNQAQFSIAFSQATTEGQGAQNQDAGVLNASNCASE